MGKGTPRSPGRPAHGASQCFLRLVTSLAVLTPVLESHSPKVPGEPGSAAHSAHLQGNLTVQCNFQGDRSNFCSSGMLFPEKL